MIATFLSAILILGKIHITVSHYFNHYLILLINNNINILSFPTIFPPVSFFIYLHHLISLSYLMNNDI